MRPLSRPLGVVRIRWGICRRGWCRRCGCQGISRDTVVRRLAHEPRGWRPTILHVSVRRYRCETCAHVWRQDMSQAADPRAKLSRAAVRWALTGLVVHHLTVARVAQALGVSWNTANTAVLAEGARLLINDPARCEGVRVIGVDEHVWRHTPYGDKYVTVILDLTPIRERSGPSRLLDMVPGRSKQVFKTWLASQPHTWRERIEIVAMDGFTGFKSAAAEELPGARAVMDTPSTSCTLLATPWMSVTGASSKNFTIGAGGPPTPCTRPAGCYTPDPACSPHANNTNYSTCFPVRSTSHSKSPGASTRTSSTPIVIPTKSAVRP